MLKTKNRASYITVLKNWSKNQVFNIGRRLAHMAIVLPKAAPIYLSSDTDKIKSKTNTTAVVEGGISRKEFINFWEDGYQAWPPNKENE